MPMLADPKLELFKLYRAYDDFEGQPLHGTFLIDAQGNVRFQRISADPFLDVEFIKAEAARVNRIVRKNQGGARSSGVKSDSKSHRIKRDLVATRADWTIDES